MRLDMLSMLFMCTLRSDGGSGEVQKQSKTTAIGFQCVFFWIVKTILTLVIPSKCIYGIHMCVVQVKLLKMLVISVESLVSRIINEYSDI